MESPGDVLQRLFEIPGYEWDTEREPFHSSYDSWHFYGTQLVTNSESSSAHKPASRQSPSRTATTPENSQRPAFRSHKSSQSDGQVDIPSLEPRTRKVVARISQHVVRLEREFQLVKLVVATSDEKCEHFVRPIEFVRLPPRNGGNLLVVSIFEEPGENYLWGMVDFGPNAYRGLGNSGAWDKEVVSGTRSQMPLNQFLHFAIGAAECCEILHYGNQVVHGEIRAEAFHYNVESGEVKMLNFGSGTRSFENGLTSAGWYSLSRELGVEHKLQFIAPEQTGRLPAEPDSRTDIYSLGILFWMMLTGETAFEGDTPLLVMQNVLSRRILPVSSKRAGIPDALSQVIQRMTQKNIDERYNSTSGLKYDLIQIRTLLSEGDSESLQSFKIAQKDISSFFNLPTYQVGREEERQRIITVIQGFAQHRDKVASLGSSAWDRSTGSSTSNTQPDMQATNESTSGSGSSKTSGVRNGDGANSVVLHGSHKTARSIVSEVSSDELLELRESRNGTSADSKLGSSGASVPANNNSAQETGRLLRDATRTRRKGRCEVIAISGAAGLGKSCLIQSVQVSARNYGYFASAKFDQARRAPFEPILRLMSSLFRQIFSESDVSTEFHNHIRGFVKPVWHILHTYLDLPESLLDVISHTQPNGLNQSLARITMQSRRSPSPSLTQAPSSSQSSTQSTGEWSRSGASRTSRFMNIFLGVLRLLASSKLIILSLDDLQYADTESLDLVHNIVTGKIPILFIITYRHDDLIPKHVLTLLSSAVKLELTPFSEEETSTYVSATLHRDRDYVVPLVAVIQEKTAGNPFFIREMLATCYRTRCIHYSWKTSAWEFDLDKVFTAFESESYGSQITIDFVSKRLQELPYSARCLLAWASLLGNSFSFSLVKRLMCGENAWPDAQGLPLVGSYDPVAGLQASISAYLIVPGGDEDRFRFSHDRYMQSANALAECFNKHEMYYAIAKTMVQHDFRDNTRTSSKSFYIRGQHVCSAVGLLRQRESNRSAYRHLLFQAAENAAESGARSTALFYLVHCMTLLQDNPWDESQPDVNYHETLDLYLKTAAAHCYEQQIGEARKLVEAVLQHARNPIDKAPAYVTKSRTYAFEGDSQAAFEALRDCLAQLGTVIPETTFEECDEEFLDLCKLLNSTNFDDLVSRPTKIDPMMAALGPVLLEIVSTAFWTNSLRFFQSSMVMMRLHITTGDFPQCGAGYLHFASIAVGRFGTTELGCRVASLAHHLFQKYESASYSFGRGEMLRALFIGHLETHVRDQIEVLDNAMDASILAGDRNLILLNLGITAMFKFWCSHDLTEVEAYTSDAPLEYPGWQGDLRGGVMLTSVRQLARALQGKTNSTSATEVFDEADFNGAEYENYIKKTASHTERPLAIYWTNLFMALFHFGHLDAALEIGERLVPMSEDLFSMRYYYSNLMYLALCYCANIRENPSRPDREDLLAKVQNLTRRIEPAAEINDVNYRGWLCLLRAEYADVTGNIPESVIMYEQALDHSQVHDLLLEDALVFELYADSLIRRGATRPARHLLTQCLSAYRRVSAYGKAENVAAKFEWLIRGTTSLNSIDAACQTTMIDTGNSPFKLAQNETRRNRTLGLETSVDRTNAWVEPEKKVVSATGGQEVHRTEKGFPRDFSAMGLDMIDLASILQSSQLLSSELQVDKLMSKMTDIILESTAAELAAIVVRGEQIEWTLASVSTQEGVQSYPDGQGFETVGNRETQQITTYVLRFKETVFLQNLLDDERFLGVSQEFLNRHPDGRSVIAIPILHGAGELLGSIYIEGPPNSFTERNLTVLQLLVNQISISLANALVLKQIEKVSSENSAMVDMQKRALAQARAAEAKAKLAELEAIRNMKLKEEAAKAKSMFLANVSHELRTPLTGVIGMSELLKETQLTQKQAGYADSIRLCADTLLSVINDLLDFTKLEAGKMNMSSLPINLTETTREVVRALSYQNNEKGLHTALDLGIDPALLVLGDPMRLHQILMNLLSNAYKFTVRGSVTVRAVTNHEEKDWIDITVSVKDTGIGIPDDQRRNLFQPFSQVENTSSRSFGGTGLGLSICKALIENMGGRIWLESMPGKGTTVFFRIRFKKVSQSEKASLLDGVAPKPDLMAHYTPPGPTSPQRMNRSTDETVPRGQTRICIAEDNPVNQKIALSFVSKLGFECRAFADGRQTIEALERASAAGSPYHLVLMDVQMPVLDGYDATREIRSHKDPAIRDVLVIAMTASAIQGDREKCLEAGMNNYLAKPVQRQTLKALLETYLVHKKEGSQGVGGAKGEDASLPAATPSASQSPTGSAMRPAGKAHNDHSVRFQVDDAAEGKEQSTVEKQSNMEEQSNAEEQCNGVVPEAAQGGGEDISTQTDT
ncbi:hypothetical protein EJ06DRAFT_573809 [Trichodelitschia bisporula]|uniref:histidine kinase n=1 Tax=Trichodelitschia bisporula TaxID=703511 RepID=A0A6G1I2J0_9PEZI|nr:hypothetical protein EJ06DRAFT_573809 [Trichodelitschia bisporula]